MATTRSEKLNALLSQFSGEDHVLILINADPDAIASALAVKRLLWRRVASTTIAHVNVIKRPDNLAMIHLLGARMVHINDLNTRRAYRVVMVDSQPNHHELFAAYKPTVIIDHHPDTGAKAAFSDIRPRYGATASILTEYLRAARITPSSKLATALYHAIKVDTSNFERQTLIEDLKAFQFLFRHANTHLARRIEQGELSLDFLKYFKIALADMQLRRGRVFIHLGQVRNPDVLVLIADFFLRLAGVSWSIVSGRCEHKLIVILRNDGIRKNAGRVAKESFGQIGSGGGHKSMSRAEIPLAKLETALEGHEDRTIARWIVQQIEKRATSPRKKKADETLNRPDFSSS